MNRPSNLIRLPLLLLYLTLVVACGRISIRHEVSPRADFSGMKTYAWIPDPDMLSLHPLVRTEERHARVMATVDRELAAKGYAKTDSGAPDFMVRYAAHFASQFSTKHRIDGRVGANVTGRYYWRPWGVGLSTYDEDSEKGMLAVGMRLPEAEEWLWIGFAEGVVQESMPAEERRKRVDTALRDILAKFPPRK